MISSNHTPIQEAHPQSFLDLTEIRSNTLTFSLVPKPTKRFLKKLALGYMCCPDCESKNITYYGKSSIGTQKHLCKSCDYQFVSQFDAFFPRSTRRWLFEREFMDNLATTGFNKGSGRQAFWEGARLETLEMIESQYIKVKINKILKIMTIQGDREYKGLLEFIIHEAYVRVIG